MKGKVCRLYQSSSIDSESELFTGAPNRGHLPIIHQFCHAQTAQSASPILHWDIDKTDWNAWRGSLNRALLLGITGRINSYTDPLKLWQDFKNILSAIGNQWIPLKKVSTHSKPFWNSLLTDLSKTLQAAQETMKTSYTPYNVSLHKQAKEEFSNTLISEKNKWIHQKLENLNVAQSQIFWKNYKKTLTNKPNEYMGNLMDGGILHSDRTQKENILYNSFFSGEHMNRGSFDHVFEQEIDSCYDNIISTQFPSDQLDPVINDHLNGKIGLEEVTSALKAQNSSAKSFDTDSLHPKILKHLPVSALQILTKLYDLVLETGVWVWEESNVTFIKKDGKDNYMNPSAYRPISISSYVGKLLEKILERRIKLHCELEGLLDEEQEGFRPQRNTARYLYKLVATLDECKRKKLTTFLLCIDFSKAFDSVWVKGLIFKLSKYQIQGNILRIINNFLLSRKVRLRVNNSLGFPRSCGWFGLPQGSVLAPLLFILYISDMLCKDQLPLECSSNSSLFKYADDGSIAVSHIDPICAHRIMQLMFKYLHVWCSKWKLIPNCDKNKTECIMITPTSSSAPDVTAFGPLIIGNRPITYTSQSTVLGLTIDEKLTFKSHAKLKLKQCWFAWYRITQNSTRHRGLNASSLKMLFKTVVLTKLLYAAPIWLNDNLDTFKDFYARVLLKISGSTHHPPRDLTSVALGIPPLEISYKMVTIKFIIKALTSDPFMQGLILQLEEAKAHRYQHHIDEIRKFLTWTRGSNELNRSKIDLLTSVHNGVVSYSKDEITRFMDFTWNKHLLLNPRINPGEILNNIDERSKKLFPRYSSRSTDTKVMSLLHGHDITFTAFKARVANNCDPQCPNCQMLDNNYHRIFSCPLYRCSYRETIQEHSTSDQPCWSILRDDSDGSITAFRSLAQIAIGELS